MTQIKNIPLKNGTPIPQIGLGTWQLQSEECKNAVKAALDQGYRHIDTAHIYNNQTEIGSALSEYFSDNELERQDLFITSKLWVDHFSSQKAARAEFEQTLEKLQTDYLDLWLIHWPHPSLEVSKILSLMADLKQEGRIKNYGISHFTTELIAKIPAEFEVAVNQVEFHPSLYQKELLEYCQQRDIVVEAYSPLMQGDELKIPVIQEIAGKHNVSAAQVILAWLLEKNIVVIPRSSNPEHIQSNLAAAEIALDAEDIKAIDAIDMWRRMIDKPEWVNFGDPS